MCGRQHLARRVDDIENVFGAFTDRYNFSHADKHALTPQNLGCFCKQAGLVARGQFHNGTIICMVFAELHPVGVLNIRA